MKTARYWLSAIVLDLLLASLYYTWQAEGIDQAGNVVIFWTWFIVVIRILVGLGSDKSAFAKHPRPAGFTRYYAVAEIAKISTLAWIGYTWLPALYLVGTMLMEGARKREPKTEGAAA